MTFDFDQKISVLQEQLQEALTKLTDATPQAIGFAGSNRQCSSALSTSHQTRPKAILSGNTARDNSISQLSEGEFRNNIM